MIVQAKDISFNTMDRKKTPHLTTTVIKVEGVSFAIRWLIW